MKIQHLLFTCFVFLSLVGSHAQVQVGNTINGMQSGNQFGTIVSLSGTGAVLGVSSISEDNPPAADEAATNALSYNAGTGTWELKSFENGGTATPGVIARISNDGLKMVVYDTTASTPQIQYYEFDAGQNQWEPLGMPLAGALNSLALSGDGNRLIRGTGTITQVYEFNSGAGAWQQLANDISQKGDIVSISNDGKRLIVQDTSGFSGSFIPYELNAGNSNWSSGATYFPFTEAGFSLSVAISPDGSKFAYSAVGFDGPVLGVSEFCLGFCNEVGQSIPLPSTQGAAFAFSEDGNRIVFAEKGTQQTSLYEFDTNADNWVQVNQSVLFSGGEVDISSNGNLVAIGNPSATDSTGQVRVFDFSQPASAPAFALVDPICENAGTQTTLGGGTPLGGTYSGPGVTDNDDGQTFTFDPATAGGPGTYTITYTTFTGQTATSDLEVLASPVVTFTPPAAITLDAGVQTGLGGGTPAGGVYSGPGVTDDGNGMTYSFDPAAAGLGTHTITYFFVDANGCDGSSSGEVTVSNPLPADNSCDGANDINSLFGGPQNEAQTSGLYDNTTYNSTDDPATGYECFDDESLEHTIWYTFTGDGNTYRIKTVQCNATNYIDFGDTQMAVYSGDCSNPTPVACNEDEDFANDVYNAYLELETVDGTNYLVMIDGWNNLDGEFCIEVTNLTPSSVTEISGTNIEVFPNPTTGQIQFNNVQADQVLVFDNVGRLVFQAGNPGNQIDLSNAPAGMYFLKITEGEQVYSARVVKE